MTLTDEQRRQITHAMDMIEQSGMDYGEIRIIYKRPYWRHVQMLTAENLATPRREELNQPGSKNE